MAYPTTTEIQDQTNMIVDNMPSLVPTDFADGLATFFKMVVAVVTRLEALEAGGK